MATRWTPWIEARIASSADVSITSTTVVDITGATITFTPLIDCLLLVTFVFDVGLTTFVAASDVFIGSIWSNGVAFGGTVLAQAPAAGIRYTLSQVATLALTGGTAYTIKLRGQRSVGAGNTWTVRATSGSTNFAFVTLPAPTVGP